jgi:HEAT repeat protein
MVTGEYGGGTLFFFQHTVLSEYLAATALKQRLLRDRGFKRKMNAMLSDPDREQVFLWYSGMVTGDVASALLSLLADPYSDDFFRHRLAFAARCLPRLPVETDARLGKLEADISRLCFWLWLGHYVSGTVAAVSHFEPALRSIALRRQKAVFGPWYEGSRPLADWVAVTSCLTDLQRCEILAMLGTAASCPAVVEVLTRRILSKELTLEAAVSAGSVDYTAVNPEALNSLLSAIEDDCRLRWQAAVALSSVGCPGQEQRVAEALNELLDDRDMSCRRTIQGICELQAKIPRNHEVVLHWVRELKISLDTRLLAAYVLANTCSNEMNQSVCQVLAAGACDPDRDIRAGALRIIAGVNCGLSGQLLVAVKDALRDDLPEVSAQAALILGDCIPLDRGAEIQQCLAERLHHPDGLVRWSAAIALLSTRTTQYKATAAAVLKDLLYSSDQLVRWTAAHSFRLMQDAQVFNERLSENLRSMSRDSNSETRAAVADAISTCLNYANESGLIVYLKTLVRDPDEGVRCSAIRALGPFLNEETDADLIADLLNRLRRDTLQVKIQIAETLGYVNADAQPNVTRALIRAARFGNFLVRWRATLSLARLVPTRWENIEPLVYALDSRNINRREEAAMLLSSLNRTQRIVRRNWRWTVQPSRPAALARNSQTHSRS